MGERPFQNLDNQIEKLDSRGMVISNKEAVKEILLRENYYNIVNGYKNIFLDKSSEEECFIKGTNFNELYRLYILDREYRNTLIKYLLSFETNLKTICAYRFAERYPNKNAYFDINSYSSESSCIDNILRNIANLSKVIQREKNKKHANSIKHYLENHDSVPIWVVVNSLTFGEISYFFNSLKNDLKEVIAKDFSDRYKNDYNTKTNVTVGALKQVIKVVNLFRNICAHEEVLYNRKVTGVKVSVFKNYYTDAEILNSIRKGNLYGLIAMLKLVMSSEEYSLMFMQLYQPLFFQERLGSFETVNIKEIKQEMGFIDDWENKIINFSEKFADLLEVLEA